MKLHRTRQKNHALTLVEVMAIILTLGLLTICLALGLVASARPKAHRITCVNHLMQINLSYRVWQGDHKFLHPLTDSTNLGGISEYVARGEAFQFFQIMSNELASPVILVCPADTRPSARDFGPAFNNTNLSYFINLDASDTDPNTAIFGDDNFEIAGIPMKPGPLVLSSNLPIAWSAARHKHFGNISFADGSIQGMNNSSLINLFRQTTLTTNRLIIP